jgi:hypothetical protein
MTKRNRKNDEKNTSREGPIEEYSIEEIDEATDELSKERDVRDMIDTAHTDGSTTNPQQAEEQGLVYEPPSDPPVLPSDDPQGAEIAAGFASSMEETNPDQRHLPSRVDNQDLDLEEDIQTVLRINSETGHLNNVEFMVENGIVHLHGTVLSEDDIATVEYVVRDLEGVAEVRNELRIAIS